MVVVIKNKKKLNDRGCQPSFYLPGAGVDRGGG
jgi:hypothetical protein